MRETTPYSLLVPAMEEGSNFQVGFYWEQGTEN